MRANSPVDNDFEILNLVEDDESIDKVSPEMKELAKASKSKPGQIILEHLASRVRDYRKRLETNNFAELDPTQVAVQVMTAQAVIQEFESVLNDVNTSNRAIADAAKR